MNGLLDGSINKLWGKHFNNLFAVGRKGSIVHYDGTTWHKLESGTRIDLTDVFGSPNGEVAWACGHTDSLGTILLKITGSDVETVYHDLDHRNTVRTDTLSGILSSIWAADADTVVVASTSGLYYVPAGSRGNARRAWLNASFLPVFPNKIRANGGNDLFVSGDFGMIWHYNGASWFSYPPLGNRIQYLSISTNNQKSLFVGVDNSTFLSRAVLAIANHP